MTFSLRKPVKINRFSANKKNVALLEIMSWQEIRDQIKIIAPDIYKVVEQLNPDKSYKLYKIRYPYGAHIIGQKGIFNIPINDRQLIPINNKKDISSSIIDQIGYNQFSIPLCLVLLGQVHLFSETKQNGVFTEGLYSTGDIVTLGDPMNIDVSYDARSIWRLTSGARTPVMLPSISDEASFLRLQRHFNLKSDKPLNQQDHWRLFVDLATNKYFPQEWYTELLIFSSKWLEHRDDNAWKLFKLCLIERQWKRSAYARNIATMNQIWDLFINDIRNKKVNRFVLSMVRYIIEASLNQEIVYAPFDNDETAGPFNSLTSIFMDIYGLKKHAPIIMVPEIFNEKLKRPFYIPMQMPGTPTSRIKPETSSSIIDNTRDTKYLLNQLIQLISQNDINLIDTAFSKLTHINYSFYHADKDKYGELIPSAVALADDPVMQKWRKYPRNCEIAYKNEFMRACVKMVRK